MTWRSSEDDEDQRPSPVPIPARGRARVGAGLTGALFLKKEGSLLSMVFGQPEVMNASW
jgi:hypothetical protein